MCYLYVFCLRLLASLNTSQKLPGNKNIACQETFVFNDNNRVSVMMLVRA